ncbi:MAG TPA: UvrD-helicase domain-containing protein [Chthonomonadaceae bacterium]|nr:UvrD-helicase domain-containing protein [Chthonomonadaceae bacterium]
MARAWTDNQARAIHADNDDICVAAGAGSGKTGVLVERFVRLVTQSRRGALPPERRAGVGEILVITFTEKATKEMKSRIVAELNRLGLVDERRQVETAYISTIHGFCSRLLQENPFEAGVDPQFTVLDEVQARRLLRQEFDAVIAAAYERDDTEIAELVAAVQSEGSLSDLAGAVSTVIAKMRGAGRRCEEVERHWLLGQEATAARSLEPVWAILTPLLKEITACLQGLERLRAGVLGATAVALDTLLSRAPLLQPQAADVVTTLAALEETQKVASKTRFRIGGAPNELTLTQLFERIQIACEEAKALFNVVAAREEEAARLCHRFWGLVVAVWKAYEAAKRRTGRLDTDDLQSEGVRLLEESPGVRARYRRRFRYLMVDEFQDTNPLQMRLIELLHVPQRGSARAHSARNGHEPSSPAGLLPADSVASYLGEETAAETAEEADGILRKSDKQRCAAVPNFLFVVGDVQQSIYGFRHADATLFRELERRFREEGAGLHVPLADNFRSRPEILRLVAHIFQQVWREARTPFVPLTPGAVFDPRPAPSLEILLTQDLFRRDYVRLEADALAARIQQMVEGQELRLTGQHDPRRGEPVSYRDVAVLLRSLTDIEKYEQAFARRGVPYFVVGGGRGYYARHEIRDLMNVLTVLDTPLDDVALAATLRSPLVGADVDTLYRLAKIAGQAGEAGKNGAGRRHRAPLYPALGPLLASGELPAEEAAKLARFFAVMEELRAQEDRLPVGHLLERLITQTHYDARLLCRPGGRRRLANVRKLLQMANSDSVMGVRDFIRRLRDLERLSEREGDAPTEEEAADVVRFLTIHSAKGLEFPVVALADLSRGLIVPERGLFACEPQSFALGTKLGGEPNVVYRAIDKRRQEADRQESERLLYVAMTRAREYLLLCGNVGRNRSTNWADSLFPLLGILGAPSEPETQTLMGGIQARVAPLAYYAQASALSPESGASARRMAEARADRLAAALLAGESLEPLLG